MTDLQIRKQNMAVVTLLVIDNNLILWETIPAIASARTLLSNSIITVDTLAVLQGTDNTGYRAQKVELLNRLADKTMVVAGPLAALARINNNQALLEKVDIHRTDIINAPETIAQDIAQLIFNEASTIDPAILTQVGITAAMMAELNAAIVAFTVSLPLPRIAESETAATTIAMAQEFNRRHNILITLDDLLEPFKSIDITFYNTYHNARKIVDTGVRRIHLIVKCTDSVSGSVVAGAEVSIVELTETLVTTKTGNARFFSLPPGSYTVTINHNQYVPVTLENVGIFEGLTKRFGVVMVKI